MNKLTKGLLTLSLSAAIVGAVACGGNSSDAWKGTTFTDYGTVAADTLGGFVAETDKYVYFINGMGSSSSDNSFGTPIKGALVAADKTDFSKSEVVIPELMVSSDYDAGVYIFKEGDGVYAYYGTPNKEKNSSGEVAYSEMTFTKTRLDGKENKKLFTVSSHSVNYRIAQAGDTVYIVYYDSDDSAIVSYNCANGKKTVIAKTDATTNVKAESGEYLSLGEYKFLKNGSGAQIIYTMTAYTQEYYSAQEEQSDSYSRQTANYNYVYLYQVGGEPVIVKNGKDKNETFALKSVVDEYVFYTATPFSGDAKTYGAKISGLGNERATEINYPDNIKDGMIIKSFSEVYYFDSDAKQVIKNTLVKTDTITEYNTKTPVLKDETVSSLISVDDNYIYCFNTDGYIAAISRTEDKTVRVSERTASSSWYAPEIVEIDGVKYMLYCDSSAVGNSYIHYAKLDFGADNVKTEYNDDNEVDYYYLESSFIGVRPAADRAAAAVAKINEIESPLDVKGEGDALYADSVTAARKAYDALDSDAKDCVADTDLAKLENAEKALKLWAAYDKLEPVLNYANLSDDEKATLRTNYDAATKLKEEYGDNYSAIAAYLTDNLNYFYQETDAKLNSSN